MTATAQELRCSFCGKPSTEVHKLVAGPGVYICDVCTDLAKTVIAESERSTGKPRLPAWETMTDDQMLDHIPRMAKVAGQVEGELRDWVQELRRRTVTWTRIGGALGISRQSAWERFSGEE